MQANMEKSTATDEVASTSQSLAENQSTVVDSIQLQGKRVKHIFVEDQLKDSQEKRKRLKENWNRLKKRLCFLRKNWSKQGMKQNMPGNKQNSVVQKWSGLWQK